MQVCRQQRQGAVGYSDTVPSYAAGSAEGSAVSSTSTPLQDLMCLNLLSPQQTLQMACLQKENAEAPENFGPHHFQLPQLLLHVSTPLCQVCNIQMSTFDWTAGSVWACGIGCLQQLLTPGTNGSCKHIFVHVIPLTTFDCTARSVTFYTQMSCDT